ncbi:hypothetical protein BKA61DRAFT_608770 [Leptodontidium sp. MPI-SDFR-AT-0119]|nr:hypothetical protein BKA61DRAFT_608770 [Leptodontidium sp. MPI-SDFR-AT-0119]
MMASSHESEEVHFKAFRNLSPTISLYRPADQVTPKSRSLSPPSPYLIILTPWLSAQPRHIKKYTDAYRTLFPSASILIIRTTVADMVYRPYSAQQADLKMILPLLQNSSGSEEPIILLHMFSNAGAHKASQLARAYHTQTKTVFRCEGMVFDSTPGVATHSRIVDAMTVGLPAIPVLRQLLACLIYGLVALIWLQSLASGGLNLVERARKDLNDLTLVQSRRGRLYVYSVKDKMVGWEDVESHAREAEQNGERVRKERWTGTAHVGHMTNDGERYWGAIKSFWNSSADSW